MSIYITIILESLLKPGDDTLGDSKFLGCFQLEHRAAVAQWSRYRLMDHKETIIRLFSLVFLGEQGLGKDLLSNEVVQLAVLIDLGYDRSVTNLGIEQARDGWKCDGGTPMKSFLCGRDRCPVEKWKNESWESYRKWQHM
ncbi:hypothetical protein TNCV_2300831 [Trichonephila clavipes]|nr:hypothetical protein TNCV_2300831 [Trichonephila clavipes]